MALMYCPFCGRKIPATLRRIMPLERRMCPNCKASLDFSDVGKSHINTYSRIVRRPMREEPRYIPLDDSGWPTEPKELENKKHTPRARVVQHMMRLYEKRYKKPLKMYSRQLMKQYAHARDLLKLVNGDMELLFDALEIQFTHPDFTWANRYHLGHCFHDLNRAVEIVEARRAELAEKIRREKSIAKVMEKEENVWE